MKYSTNSHGRSSRQSPATDALREEWEMADKLNSQGGEGEWVPRDAVFTRTDILPRAGDYMDSDKVKEYAQVFRQLPPIHVQKDTFVLIDGRHRLNAAFEQAATSLHIRIIEDDVPDDQLREAAFKANIGHGVPYRLKDRIEHLKYLLLTKKDTRPDAELAATCGLSRSAVIDNRHKWTGREHITSPREPAKSESYSTSAPPVRRPIPTPNPSRVKDSRDMRREPEPTWDEWEEPSRQVEDQGAETPIPQTAKEKFDRITAMGLLRWFQECPVGSEPIDDICRWMTSKEAEWVADGLEQLASDIRAAVMVTA